MAGSIARQPWRLGFILLILAVFVAGLLFIQAVFSGPAEQAGTEAEIVSAGTIDSGGAAPRAGNLSSEFPPSTPVTGAQTLLADPETPAYSTFTGEFPGSSAGWSQPPVIVPGPPSAEPGVLSGRVWTGNGSEEDPITHIAVYLADAGGNLTGARTWTGDDGKFSFAGLAPGDYKLFFFDIGGTYESAWYGSGSPSGAPIRVEPGREASISQAMRPATGHAQGSISGRVANAAGRGIEGVEVLAYSVNEDAGVLLSLQGVAVTDGDGNYTVANLPPTEPGLPGAPDAAAAGLGYKILFTPLPLSGYSPQWYRGQSTHATAKIISLRPGEVVSGIDALLDGGGSISGKVTADGQPAAGAFVDIFNESGIIVGSHWTDAQGNYQSDLLAAGSYKVRVTAPPGFRNEWYNDKTDFASADPVFVVTGQDSGGINIVLDTQTEPANVLIPEQQVPANGVVSPGAAGLAPLEETMAPPADVPVPPAGGDSPDDGAPAGQASDSVIPPDQDEGQVAGEGGQHQVITGQTQVDKAGQAGAERAGQGLHRG